MVANGRMVAFEWWRSRKEVTGTTYRGLAQLLGKNRNQSLQLDVFGFGFLQDG
jgi:hypothetical protein